MTPKISILIPVYNVAAYIERCAHSLFQQTLDSIEFVFVDDASPDDSIALLEKVVEEYPHRKMQVNIIRHPVNQGIGATRNTLLNAATGEYLMWVDSDDFLDINSSEFLYQKAVAGDVDIVTTDIYYSYREDSDALAVEQSLPADSCKYIEALAFREARAALWGTLSKRSLWVANQVKMAEGVNFGEDYFATVRLFYFARKIEVVNQPLYYYNQSNLGSYSSGCKQALHFESMIRLFQLLEEFFVQNNDLPRYELYLAKARLMERSAYLLHTTAALRRKYALLFADESTRHPEIKLPLSAWQKFLLNLITSQRFIAADIFILVAKVLRRYLGVKF